MKQGEVSIQINAPADYVFSVIHDYSIRLKWDTMLSEARLLEGASTAAKGAITRCVGHGWMKLFPVEAVYLTFKPGEVAAVKMINRSLVFRSFSATIRHKGNGDTSTVSYRYAFEVKPRFLKWLLQPIVNLTLNREVDARLQSLREYCETIA